jgi:uncharacterized phage protein (TIGR02218 family)
MAFDPIERSADQGAPVEIYTFTRGSIVWRHTSADTDQEVEFQTYKRAVIRRGGIEQGSEMNRSGLKLTVPRDFPIAELYQVAPPSDAITLTLRQYHAGDGELVVVWSGRIIAVTFSDSQAEINLEPIGTSLRRTGLRRLYQRQCPHVLYGSACGLAAVSYRLTAEVSAVSALNITAAALAGQPDGYWEGGFLEWEVAAGVYERRFIFGHTGDTVEVDTVPLGLTPGTEVNFYPGCDHSLATCAGKFSNEANYGGMPYIPLKNPYGSDPVY